MFLLDNISGGNMNKKKDENYVYEFVGKNVAKYRKLKGWTQEQLADKSTYSKQFISNIENNVHQTFSLGTLISKIKILFCNSWCKFFCICK